VDKIFKKIAEELNIRETQVEATVKLIDEGNTIPFIARYRKEVTGNLSDEILRDLWERLTYLRNLEKRKEEIEVRNNAESLVYNSQKTLDELGDKISGEEKAKVEEEIENVRKTLDGTNIEEIKEATEKLTKVFYDLSEKLYSAQAAAEGATEATATADNGEAKEGTVYDADYKVEDDDNK